MGLIISSLESCVFSLPSPLPFHFFDHPVIKEMQYFLHLYGSPVSSDFTCVPLIVGYLFQSLTLSTLAIPLTILHVMIMTSLVLLSAKVSDLVP